MCIVINGPVSSGKSKLSLLILNRLAERNILSLDNVRLDEYKGVKLFSIFPIGISLQKVLGWKSLGLSILTSLSEPSFPRKQLPSYVL